MLYRLQEFWKRYPDVTGDDLALTVGLAIRRTMPDLRYRWLVSTGTSLTIWLGGVTACLGLPFVAMIPAVRLVTLWVQNQTVITWTVLVLYLCLCVFFVALYNRNRRLKRFTEKVQRRAHIYAAARAYKQMVLRT